MENELEVIFANKQLRLTEPRKVVFRQLHSATTPLSIANIASKCPSIDRVSIYRTIELFQQLDIVRPLPLGWKHLYELTSPFKAHHHHLSCTVCGRLIDVHSKKFEQIVASVAKEYEFAPQDHTFEIKGVCRDCR
ncbi:MAG: Fur family transcriptional regulator [Candidatus Saccharimonadales bacterium]